MALAAKRNLKHSETEKTCVDLSEFVPQELRGSGNGQSMIPRIAKDEQAVRIIEQSVQTVPTTHRLHLGDARKMPHLTPESVHLVLTSPPYWTLKEYRDSAAQLGHIEDYEQFLHALDQVWKQCFDVLVPGGRLICVVGDVCLS